MANGDTLKPPFVDNGNGYPTESSVQKALADLGMGDLAQEPASYRGESGQLVPLISSFCRLEHVSRGYPEEFKKVVSLAILAG